MFTNNIDFYPTPKSLAIKMACMIDQKFTEKVLEPSAGKGDLAEAVLNRLGYGYRRNSIDCIEIDENLRSILQSKNGVRVIDTNFLNYFPTKQYDTIIMNPPFSNGAAHVLKAWEIIYNGDVIALLNAETLRNRCTKERELLGHIVDTCGEIEYIQNAFLDAERKTQVEVALIKISKRNDIQKDYFKGMEKSRDIEEPEFTGSQLAVPSSQIENSVRAYNKAIELQKEAILKYAESEYYAKMIRKSNDETFSNDTTSRVKNSLNDYVDKLRESAWEDIANMADFRRHMTERVQKEFGAKLDTIKKMEFTASNIREFLKNLIENQTSIANQCLLDVFDLFTKYHPENRVHVEGWKSNDVFFVGRRVVLPYMTELQWSGGIKLHYSKRQTILDIDRVSRLLVGGNGDSINDVIEGYKNLGNEKIKTKNFTLRFYKKGTMHLYFDNKKLLDQLNIMVGRHRGWLPNADDLIPKEFWLMNG